MKIYHYDSIGLFLGSSDADPDPLEPGKFLMPANSTRIAPIGDENVFINGAWVTRADNRGKQVWDLTTGESSEIDYLGAIKLGFTDIAPPAGTIFDSGKWVVDIAGITARARGTRNGLLAASDYLMLPDAAIVNGIREYRQALRDLPKSSGWPTAIRWPDMPRVESETAVTTAV